MLLTNEEAFCLRRPVQAGSAARHVSGPNRLRARRKNKKLLRCNDDCFCPTPRCRSAPQIPGYRAGADAPTSLRDPPEMIISGPAWLATATWQAQNDSLQVRMTFAVLALNYDIDRVHSFFPPASRYPAI